MKILLLFLLNHHAIASETKWMVRLYQAANTNPRFLVSEVACKYDSEKPNENVCEGSIERFENEWLKSGDFTIRLTERQESFTSFSVFIFGDGYVGGGDDAPFFLAEVITRSSRNALIEFSLGFFSKTPDKAGEYTLEIELGERKLL